MRVSKGTVPTLQLNLTVGEAIAVIVGLRQVQGESIRSYCVDNRYKDNAMLDALDVDTYKMYHTIRNALADQRVSG